VEREKSGAWSEQSSAFIPSICYVSKSTRLDPVFLLGDCNDDGMMIKSQSQLVEKESKLLLEEHVILYGGCAHRVE